MVKDSGRSPKADSLLAIETEREARGDSAKKSKDLRKCFLLFTLTGKQAKMARARARPPFPKRGSDHNKIVAKIVSTFTRLVQFFWAVVDCNTVFVFKQSSKASKASKHARTQRGREASGPRRPLGS